jgi:hypothetical protein
VRKPILVVTAYFVDAVEARLKQDFELRRQKNGARCALEVLEVSKLECLERQTVIDPIPALFVCVLPDGPLVFGGGSWLTSRKSTRSFKVLHPPHGWRPLRVIACMPTQPWNASSGSISDQINQADWRSFLLEEDGAIASASRISAINGTQLLCGTD